MSGGVVIVDFGMGNLHSVVKRVRRTEANWSVTSEAGPILKAERLILPGVGHFGRAMENLNSLGLIEALNEAVNSRGTPILGICLGMQLMAKFSEEGDSEGLGWFDARVVRFQVQDKLQFKVPHIGWNQIIKAKPSRLDDGIPDLSEFYFVHSFHIECADENDILHRTRYEATFASAIQKKNLYGVQYHPEKSHDVGMKLFENFLEITA